MANAITALNPANWRLIVQDFLNNILVATDIANTQFKADLVVGDTINFPYMNDVYTQDYIQGTDLTVETLTATQSALTVDQSKAVIMAIDPVQERQAKADYAAKMSYQAAFQLSNQIDRKLLATAVAGASTTIAGGVLSTSTIYPLFTTAYSQLYRNNAVDGELFAVIDAERKGLIAQSAVANLFQGADNTFGHGYQGDMNGFRVYVSNNLPTTVTLAMPTIPTAGGTFTFLGITWTWVAAGAAAAAGDIAIGINVAASKANFLLAMAGTATGSAATYVDVSAANRTKLKNVDLVAGVWGATAADTVVLTAVGKFGASETVAEADFVFGTETVSMLFGKMGAVALGMQMQPNLYLRDEPKQLARNFITHTLYGTKVFTRDANRLVKVTCTM